MRAVMLPISIGVHVLAAIALLIVPLAAEVEWPTPAPLHSLVLTTVAPVPPDVVALVPPRNAAPVNSSVAPSKLESVLSSTPDAPAVDAAADSGGAPGPAAPVDPHLPTGIGTPVNPPAPAQPEARVTPQLPLRIGQGVREPRKILDVPPVYPDIALRARIEGVVILEAVINERGTVERVKVLRSVPLLDAAAVEAVSRWRYTPTLLNGTPVSVLMSITVNFTLHP
jgi:protein TonB